MFEPAASGSAPRAQPIAERLTSVGRAAPSWRALAAAVLLSLALGLALPLLWSGKRESLAPAAPHHGTAKPAGPSSLPLAAQPPISAALGSAARAYQIGAAVGGYQANSPAQRLRERFTSSGVFVNSGIARVGLSLSAAGYGSSLRPLSPAAPRASDNRVTYRYPDVSEWYVNGPLGLEQGFTISRAPAARVGGPLTLAMSLSGDVRASLGEGGRAVLFSHAGATAVRYGGVVATDARGRPLPAALALDGSRLLLRVQSADARYPLRIDPFIQGAKVSEYGVRALSGDGNTALLATRSGELTRVAFAFARTGETWALDQQLTLSEGGTHEYFGWGEMALSGDGQTALVGGERENGDAGAAWAFARSASTWTQQGPQITGSGQSTGSNFGHSSALSGDGNTALIGAPGTGLAPGAAYVFTRSGSTWTQQQMLTGSGQSAGSYFGDSVALSSDGNTALIGAPYDNTNPTAKRHAIWNTGAAWIFTRSGSTWTQQAMLIPAGGKKAKAFGWAVALSGDGNTALIGEPGAPHSGVVWVLTRSGETWTQGPELRQPPIGKEKPTKRSGFGDTVALSADGNRALVGAPSGEGEHHPLPADYVFEHSGAGWSLEQTLMLSGETQEDAFGGGLLSADGNTALIFDREGLNEGTWMWVDAPTVTGISPMEGSSLGGTTVNITGTNLSGASAVMFGTTKATNYTVNSPTSITAVSPSGTSLESVNVTVTTSAGTSATGSADRFTYGP